MTEQHKNIIWELFQEARKLDRYCMTSREWQEFETEIHDLLVEVAK